MAVDSVWKAVAVDVGTGANPVELVDAVISPISFGLNEAGGGDISMRTTQPLAAELLDPDREIQIWWDDQILFWGPVVTEDADRDQIKVEYAGARWYFTRRFFGRADRVNLLDNGDFEDGADDWTAVGLTPVVDPFRYATGHRSIRLTGAAQDHNAYFSQTYTHSQVHPAGDLLTLAAWVWVGSDDYTGTAIEARGLYAEHRDTLGALIGDTYSSVIDDDTVRGEFIRLDKITIPNVLEGQTVEVRLYPPAGTAWYDLAVFVLMESLSFVEQDLATIITGVVNYAQNRIFDHGKTDVGIGTDCPPTGISLSRTWQFADHENIDDQLAVFTTGRNGVDLSIEVTATTRTLTLHYPQQGVLHEDPLVYDDNMLRFKLARNRNQKADTTVVLGPGDGPDREEGGATTTPNGPSLEDVTTAPDGTPPGQLDHLAAERVAVISHPEVLEVVCTGLIGVAGVGDWFPVTIDCDAVQVGPNEIYRVVRMVVNPADDTVTMTMNLREPVTPEEAMARFPRAVDACLAPGGGVWVVGSDGGVGAYGVADYHGSMGGETLNAPMVAIVPHGPDGYWLVAADTGIFAFGDAPARGGWPAMIATEYALGDRAVVAAEAVDPEGDDTLILICDDGNTYAADLTP